MQHKTLGSANIEFVYLHTSSIKSKPNAYFETFLRLFFPQLWQLMSSYLCIISCHEYTFLLKKKNCLYEESLPWAWDKAVPVGPQWVEPQLNKSTKKWEQRIFHSSNNETVQIGESVISRPRRALKHKLTLIHSFYTWRNWASKRFSVWGWSET